MLEGSVYSERWLIQDRFVTVVQSSIRLMLQVPVRNGLIGYWQDVFRGQSTCSTETIDPCSIISVPGTCTDQNGSPIMYYHLF
jgi:hypothetical protein